MNVLVTHDANGSIKSIGLAVGGRQGIGIKAGSGQHVSVVEIAEVEHIGHLGKYLIGHRVEFGEADPRLVKT